MAKKGEIRRDELNLFIVSQNNSIRTNRKIACVGYVVTEIK